MSDSDQGLQQEVPQQEQVYRGEDQSADSSQSHGHQHVALESGGLGLSQGGGLPSGSQEVVERRGVVGVEW